MPKKKRHQDTTRIQSTDSLSSDHLPSRSEVQRQKKKKKKSQKKRRFTFPLIKLLALFFILMPIAIILFMDYFEEKTLPLLQEISNTGYETVNIYRTPTVPASKVTKDVQESTVDSSTAPVTDEQEKVEPEKQENHMPSESVIKEDYHIVVPGDTLFNLSIKYYQSKNGMELIREWNNLNSDEIQLGQKLKVPVKE